MDMDANTNAIAATVATSTINAANLPTNEDETDNVNENNDYVLPNGPSVYTMFGGGCGVESCSGGGGASMLGGGTNSGSDAYKWQKRRQFSIPSALLFTNGPNGRERGDDNTNTEHIHITYNHSGPCDAGVVNMGHATTNDSLVDDIHDVLIANAQQFQSQPHSQSQSQHMPATKARRKTKRRDIKLQSNPKLNPKTNSPYRKSKTKTKRRAKK